MGKISGSNARLQIDGELVGYSNSITINLVNSPVDVTDRESAGHVEREYGLGDWNADSTAFIWFPDPDGKTGVRDLITAQLNKVKVDLTFDIVASGGVSMTGPALITNITMTGGTDGEYLTYDASFEAASKLELDACPTE
jgi:predicted secreted protein